jgi:hypothetical protein
MVFSGLFLEDIGINNLILIRVNYWNFKKSEIFKNSSYAVDMVSFENFVKLVSPRLSELKVTPIFCFDLKIPDNVTASTTEQCVLRACFRNLDLRVQYVL